jgi:hypothetical protein
MQAHLQHTTSRVPQSSGAEEGNDPSATSSGRGPPCGDIPTFEARDVGQPPIDTSPRRTRPLAGQDVLLNSKQTRARVGGVTTMSLWRWQRDPRVMFPPPDVIINNRNYWLDSTVRRFNAARVERTAQERRITAEAQTIPGQPMRLNGTMGRTDTSL